MKIFRLSDRIYHNDFELVVNCGWEEFLDTCREYLQPDHYEEIKALGTKSGLYVMPKNRNGVDTILVYIGHFDFKIVEIATLTHELKHMTDAVMDRVGITDKSEAPCYYLEYLLTMCLEALHDYKREQDEEQNARQKEDRERRRNSKKEKGGSKRSTTK